VPRVMWAITGLWLCLLLGASLLWPMSEGYDEAQHIDMAYDYSAQPFHFYAPGRLPLTRAISIAVDTTPRYPPTEPFGDIPDLPRAARPSLAAMGGHSFQPGSLNQMEQHPPLYYWLEAGVLSVPGVAGLSWDLQVWLMRLLSVAMLAPLPLLCWASTRRLLLAQSRRAPSSPDAASRLAVLAGVLPLTVPNLIRDGSSVTNDALLILTTSVLLYMLTRVLTGDLTLRTACGVALSVAAALWTKGFSLVMPPVILAAYLVGGWRRRWRPLVKALAAVVAGVAVGAAWWVRNVVAYGVVQPDGFGPHGANLLYGKPDNHGTITAFIPQFLHDFAMRIWGGIGIPDAPSPGPVVIWGWLALVGVGVLVAVLVGPAAARRRQVILLAATALVVALVAYGSWAVFKHWSHGTHGTQGRYIYQTLVAVFAVSTIGWIRLLRPRRARWAPPIVLAAALATNAAAWLLILRSWYRPQPPAPSAVAAIVATLHHLSGARLVAPPAEGGWHGAVTALMTWSPLPPAATIVLVFVLPVVSGLIALGFTVRSAAVKRHPVAPPADYPAPTSLSARAG
jgi:4-amino-4-deoxy-L-arabinose transferase-like glycosyltransferase